MGSLLQVEALSVRQAGRAIVRTLSLAVNPGELLVVLGPNGVGKSTLLRALAGELKWSEGRVRLGGRALNQWPAPVLARHRGVMPQNVELSFPLTVEEVVQLGRPREAAGYGNRIVSDLMQLLSVEHLRNRLVPGLSGGEQQRVQLARVLAQVWDSPGPVLLLLDECTSALDPAHQQQVFGLLRALAERRGYGVLAVAHDLNLAARYGHRLLLMNQGRGYREGAPEEVLTAGTLQAVFGLKARVMQLSEGYPMVIPAGDDQAVSLDRLLNRAEEPENSGRVAGYRRGPAPAKSSCRQAS